MPSSARRNRQEGQILIVFALALVAIVAMTGLVLDGGSTFVQQRGMQNVADAASMAGAYAYGNSTATDDATKRSVATLAARSVAEANGYKHGVGEVVVDVSLDSAGGAGRHITVTVTRPHENNFSGIVGMSSWDVTTTATTLAGRPNSVRGAMPIIFNQKAFDDNGAGASHPVTYDEPLVGSSDVPQTASAFNWTVYCDECNADSNTVDALINQGGAQTAVTIDDHISPLNAGAHTTLFSDMSLHVGEEFPVPIVDDAGRMVGWAMFHLTGAVGGSSKQISGYFVTPFNGSNMTIIDDVSAGGDFGSYIVKLVN